MPSPPALSVVVPVYGCAACLPELHSRLLGVLEATGEDWEVLYVDDGSLDGSWQQLERMAAADSRVRPWRMDRNRGQAAAIRAGLERSGGERIVVMDCDLQDPPEAIPRLLARARSGSEIVFTLRPPPVGYGWARRLGTAAYLRLRDLGRSEPQPRYSSFSVVSRRVARAVLAAEEGSSYLLALRAVDAPSVAVEVHRPERYAGRSSYTLVGLSKVALGNLAAQYLPRMRRRRTAQPAAPPRRSRAPASTPAGRAEPAQRR